jgi:hypothetical protein
MSRERDQDPNERPTEGRRDMRNLNLKPEDAEGPLPGDQEERSFAERGTGASNADAAPAAAPTCADGEENADHAREAVQSLEPEEKPDQLADKEAQAEDRQEALIDEGVEETFPASDPVSVKRIT